MTSRQAWTRLALLAAVLVGVLVLIVLGVAWLVPANAPSRTVEYPLADLEVGVPVEFRPAELRPDGVGRTTWIWLVRQSDGTADAF
ncbi:MAG: hypothetical protein EXR66_04275 [Dehalococcoidia bacterium]|nr:hypothetical protein [Dehalococcoidia bacterium]